ncbi:MAG TPA: hypothetical protein VGN95_14625 [Pyrinomonadaceae bacterium]|jgi:hypothetical protein|nr:hypothetical protein [Pyrinomonadaceae bacterium]
MKLEDYRKTYYEASVKTSEIVRQLAFAGIAIIWVFNDGEGGKYNFHPYLFRAGILIAIGLTLDLLHYISRTLIWGIYTWWKEKQGIDKKADFKAPRKNNWLPIFFFATKIIAVVSAYVYIIRFLAYRLL